MCPAVSSKLVLVPLVTLASSRTKRVSVLAIVDMKHPADVQVARKKCASGS